MDAANESPHETHVFRDLKRLVNEYLRQSPIDAVGPTQIYIKGAILVGSWILTYILLMMYGPSHAIIGALLLGVLFVLTCGLEFSIMHDASHQAFSTNKMVNAVALNFTLGVIGGCPMSWHEEHVVSHHGHTNVLGSDPDVYAAHVLRLHPDDKSHWWHRWQHLYAIPLYSFMWLHWFFLDIRNAVLNTYELKGKRYWLFWVLIVWGWIPHLVLGLVIPYIFFQNMWVVGIGYAALFMLVSITMAMTFVLAHVSDGRIFFETIKDKRKDWAVHQLETTMDFSVDNRFLNWLLGGLNFQVEHHIFPGLCHLHYPEIQKIVKQYCLENGIPYHESKTVIGAVWRHLVHLKTLSK